MTNKQCTVKNCTVDHAAPNVVSAERAKEMVKELDSWELKDNKLVKSFSFSSFKDSIDWVNRAADLSDNHNHHPEIYIWKRDVRLTFWTHKLPGLTEADFSMAKNCDNHL